MEEQFLHDDLDLLTKKEKNLRHIHDVINEKQRKIEIWLKKKKIEQIKLKRELIEREQKQLDQERVLDEKLSFDNYIPANCLPKTILYFAGGTRRRAVLSKIAENDYMDWQRRQFLQSVELVFSYGVENIILSLLTPNNFSEKTPNYREHLWQWVLDGLAGKESVSYYQQKQWRVRLLYSEYFLNIFNTPDNPDNLKIKHIIDEVNNTFLNETASKSENTIWVLIVPEENMLIQWLITACKKIAEENSILSIDDIILKLYGEKIPPATLFLDFGKPHIATKLLPPFLTQNLHGYWLQKPGYLVDEKELRSILYDYAVLRPTWQEDKTGRAELALDYKMIWETAPTIGIGSPRLGPHWYPNGIVKPEQTLEHKIAKIKKKIKRKTKLLKKIEKKLIKVSQNMLEVKNKMDELNQTRTV